jgi:acyl dehydratase
VTAIWLADMAGRVGEDFGTSKWYEITQDLINVFAEVTEDKQFIHLDADRARTESPYGGTVAHGFLTTAMLSRMAYDILPVFHDAPVGINYGFNKLRFLAPVPSGAQIRGQFSLTNFEDRGADALLFWAVTVAIEGQIKPALAAEWIHLRVRDKAAT